VPRSKLHCPAILVLWIATILTSRSQEDSVFGQATQSEAALMGVLYDFKQTTDGKGTPVTKDSFSGIDDDDKQGTDMTQATYSGIIQEFLIKNWDERVLNRFYRVTRPLFTTQIFIPRMSASSAPRAFGAEKLMEPSLWLIHYKAQVSAPSAGSWRFVGSADDMLAVAVNQKTVLVANRYDIVLPKVTWKSTEPNGRQAANNPLRIGDWISLEAGQIIDLDVIIGERPGGSFNAFLFIEKKGGNYEHDAEGHKILPIFQVAPFDTPTISEPYQGPQFAKGHPPWKSYQ
jgi:hypothetical protein